MHAWFPGWTRYESVAKRECLTSQGFVMEPVLVLVWEGDLQPLPNDTSEAVNILADLAEDRTVLVQQGGLLRHSADCVFPHAVPEPLQNRDDYGVVFHLRVEHPQPPAHPKAYALRPSLEPELYHTQGHVNADGSLCPYTATDDDWNGHRDTLAKYLRQGLSILLAKHLYWEWTGAATRNGVWPGIKGPHGDYQAALEALRRPPTVQCRCGSGRPHKDCHIKLDQRIVRDPLGFRVRDSNLARWVG